LSGAPRITLIVAVAENGVIGRDGQLPWRLPTDLKRFRELTLGKPVIMGRRTYLSLGKPLAGRDNIILSRQPHFHPAGVYAATGIEEALAVGNRLAAARGVDEVMVIGGEEIFRLALDRAERIHLTLVHANPPGDARFDPPGPPCWAERARTPMPQGPNDQFPADFIVLDRQG
jgi:dihydrofolate reductase